MAHFFKYANRVMHSGASKDRDDRNERLRQSGLKAQGNISHQDSISEVKASFMKKREEEKRMREMFKKNKGSAVQNALNKQK